MGNRTGNNRSGSDDGPTQISYSSNRLNQITGSTRSDNGGAAFSSALSYDKSGNLLSEPYKNGGYTYSYDDADRLTSIVGKSSSGINQSKSEFVYDGFSRKVVSNEYSWDGTGANAS